MNKLHTILLLIIAFVGGTATASFLLSEINDAASSSAKTEGPINVKVDPVGNLTDNQHYEDRLNSLHQLLESEITARTQIVDDLQILTDKISDLENQLSKSPDNTQTAALVPNVNTVVSNSSTSGFNSEALANAGVENYLAIELVERWNQHQLAQLELRDTAAREGWLNSPEFRDAFQELNENRPNLREAINDAQYDLYLYESGQNNRVLVESIIAGSAAKSAGLQAGDQLISYAGQTVFTTRDLQQATRDGIRGEYVVVEYQRNSQVSQVSLPRGPLGIMLDSERVQPN